MENHGNISDTWKNIGRPWKTMENQRQTRETHEQTMWKTIVKLWKPWKTFANQKTWNPWKSMQHLGKHAKLWKTCGFFFQRLTKPVPPPQRSPPWQPWNCRNHPLQNLISLLKTWRFPKIGVPDPFSLEFSKKPSILPPWLWKPQRAKETHWISHNFPIFFAIAKWERERHM